jgi:hypothetical protein
MFSTYGKALASFVAAVLTAAVPVVTGGHFGPVEKVQVAIAVATAASVYLVPAFPNYPHAKTAIAALLAALNLAASLLVAHHGLSFADWVSLVIAALGVLAVHKAPAVSLARPTATSGR